MDTHQYVHTDVTSGHFCYWRFYYTYHSHVDTHQYVHYDVLSVTLLLNFYYTTHNDTDAPQYVHTDVPSEFSVSWMIYYIHHSSMDAHQYVHVDVPSGYIFTECFITNITAIWTLTTMYMLM